MQASRPQAATAGGGPIRRWGLIWLGVIAAVCVIGTAGYVVLGRWSLEDAFYMTAITLTTVGYREVRELDALTKAWTIVLGFGGVALIFGTVGLVAETVLADRFSGRRERRRMAQEVERLSGHYILCGYGRVGRTVARELAHDGAPFVVIDQNPTSVDAAAADGFLVVGGDATSDEVLTRAGVDRARGLITTVDTDANNVYVTLSARARNPSLFIVARANAEGSEDKLRQAGADRVVSPYTRAGRTIAELAIRPRVADFIDYALSHGDLAFSIEELEVAEGGPIAGQTVGSLVARGIHPLAIARGQRDFEANPGPDRVLAPGDHLIVSGTAEILRALRQSS
jgi:voltage-gated potassium channel